MGPALLSCSRVQFSVPSRIGLGERQTPASCGAVAQQLRAVGFWAQHLATTMLAKVSRPGHFPAFLSGP